MKIKNISKGSRGLHAVHGTVMLAPGQEIEAEMSEAEHTMAYLTGWFNMPTPEGEERAAGKKGS